MAQGIDISIIGDKKLIKKFLQMPLKLQKTAARKGIRKGAKIVLSEIKRRAPTLSGKLKRGMKLKALKQKKGVFGIQIITPKRVALGISPEDKYYYPVAVELGSSGVRGTGFMRKSLKSKEGQVIRIFANEIKTFLNSQSTSS